MNPEPPALTVDLGSPVPPYEQIRGQIAALIHGGVLGGGARLPTMRALAADLGVAVGTAARAYAELESAGLVASRRRTGTVVTGGVPVRGAQDRVRAAADVLARAAREDGVDEATVVAVVRAALLRTAGG